jgi:hypothetical protein
MKTKMAVALMLTLILAGCSSTKSVTKNSELKPDSDSIRPKPVSTVFNRPRGSMTLIFANNGQLQELVARASAPIAGNNAFSVEQAAQVAKLRAQRNISEFLGTQVNSQRTLKVLSTAVQKSLENTTNGMSEETRLDDRDFDANGDPIIMRSDTQPVHDGNPNTNSEKIAQLVKETVITNSAALLRGLIVSDEQIDPAGRTVTVEVRTGPSTIGAANELRKQMGSN